MNCQLADPGYYVSSAGATSQTACPRGSYTSSSGEDKCSAWWARGGKGGSCCAGMKRTAPPEAMARDANAPLLPCVPPSVCSPGGTFAGNFGSSGCVACPGGTYSYAGVGVCRAW